MGKKVIVVGANHAGTACINRIIATDPEAEVLVIERNSNVSFLGCGMALWIGGQISKPDGLFYSSCEALEKAGAKVLMSTEVTSVDYDAKTVHYEGPEGSGDASYDELVLACGSSPIQPKIEGMNLEYVQVAKRFQDAELAVEQIKSDTSINNVVVVGAGYIGAELAEAYRRVGKNVVLIDSLDRILGTHFDRDFSNVMVDRLRENGIDVRTGEMVERLEGETRVTGVVTDKGHYDADLVMMCIGFRPNNGLAGDVLDLAKNGAIRVDRHQRTSREHVYAIGDCATIYDNSIRSESYIALATNAVRSGLVAALNVCGVEIESLGVQGSSALCLYGLKMVCTGQTVETAAAHGIEAEQVDFADLQKPAFMDEVGANPEVKIRIVYRKDDHVVIGAQLMSEYDMSAVIHMFSLAIQEQVTIERIALCDLFFMPHFNQPYNYITMASLSAL